MSKPSILPFKPKRSVPVTRQLAKAYGGKWRHIGFTGTWQRTDEDNWYLFRISSGFDEFDNPYPWNGRVVLCHPYGESLYFNLWHDQFPKINNKPNHE